MNMINHENAIIKMIADEYVKGDSCYATIIGGNSKGSHLKLDNGQRAFSFSAANLQCGTKIICTITKSADGRKNALAQLDSICGLYDACA